MTTNGQGTDHDMERDLAYYARLPPKVRRLLRETPMNVSAYDAFLIEKKWTLTEDELLEELVNRLDQLARNDTRKVYGAEHPQSSGTRLDIKMFDT